jgi:predicted RNase H-like nuclease
VCVCKKEFGKGFKSRDFLFEHLLHVRNTTVVTVPCLGAFN